MEANTQIVLDNETKSKFAAPRMYAVLLFNDDITTMDFVVDILIRVFHKPPQEASAVMMQVHECGQGVAGVYTFDIAVTKKAYADQLAAEKGFPLRLAVREA